MKRRSVALALTVLTTLAVGSANAAPPVHEPRVVPGVSKVLPPAPCTAESMFELSGPGRTDAPYDKCERLKVVFGPIWAKPGQNDVLIQPVTFEKPVYPGYLTRFKPDLVGADGGSPRVKDLHLHHGTWLNAEYFGDVPEVQGVPSTGRRYGWGPWIASGEEKTIAVWPKGYGLKILDSDTWLFLHMIHNATAQTFPVWVTYDLDFIPVADAENPALGDKKIKNTKGIWLDVGDCSWHADCEKDSFNPIFNIQRGYGDGGVCVFPRENCAQQNTLADKSAQQGVDVGPVFDDWTIPESGTIVVMGGHLHFGGLRDEVSLVRNLGPMDASCKPTGPTDIQTRMVHVSDALYWDQNFDPNTYQAADAFDRSKNLVGGVPTSWDMVMTGVTKDNGWSINVQKCDKLRLEGVYDAKMATWYEQMGIVMAWLSPGESSGFDPFTADIQFGLNKNAVNPDTAAGYSLPGSEFPMCDPAVSLCVRGQATHARIPTSGDHWTCEFNGCPDTARTAAALNQPTTDIPIGGFSFGPADLAVVGTLGIPTVAVGQPVTFWNADTADYMWHTVTRCANPCSGTTSASYPVANGAYDDLIDPATGKTADGKTVDDLLAVAPDSMDFDSGQLGVGTGATNKLSWEFTPTRAGTYTFFCRIHPEMRGAIRVVDA